MICTVRVDVCALHSLWSSRRVLIQPKAEGLLPGWLRFVQGVVDSEDVPLSVSREHLQDQRIIQRISSVITKRVLKEFKDLLRRDSKAYDKFYDEFGIFLKEGIHTDVRYKDELSGLLRVESSLTPEGLIRCVTGRVFKNFLSYPNH